MKRPIALDRLPADIAEDRWERMKQMAELCYPLSAREIAEHLDYKRYSVNSWFGGRRLINDRILNSTSKTKVRLFIKNAEVERIKKGEISKIKLLDRVISKLNFTIKNGTKQESRKASQYLKSLI